MMNATEIIARMIKASGAKNMTEMLKLMGFSHGAGSTWKKRGDVPDGSIAKVAESTGVYFKWLKTGKGEMRPNREAIGGDHLDPELARMVIAELQSSQGNAPLQLTAEEAAILEMIRDLPKNERKRVEYEIMTAWVACRREGRLKGHP
jgi:hypothetical protein